MAGPSGAHKTCLAALQLAERDASSVESLARRTLAILKEAIGFDDAELIALDPESLLFTRLLAYHGDRIQDFAYFIQHVHLVAREPPFVNFFSLLRDHGGSGAIHERYDRWLRIPPPDLSQADFSAEWLRLNSPPGGGLRYGLSYRRRWVAVLQCARWSAGDGFRARDLELLDRAGPSLGAALAGRLLQPSAVQRPSSPLPTGYLLFSPQRTLVALDGPARRWLSRLPDDGLRPFGLDIPIAIQSVVSFLAGYDTPSVESRVVDRQGMSVTVRGERSWQLDVGESWQSRQPQRLGLAYSVSLAASQADFRHPALAALTQKQRTVAMAVAEGLSDAEIAERLGKSVNTVHEVVGLLHRLLDARSRSALVAALARGS